MMDTWLSLGIAPVSSVELQADWLLRRQCGVIVVRHGRFSAVRGRWIPKRVTIWQSWIDQRFRSLPSGECRVYYRQPWSAPNYLTLDYLISGPNTTVATVNLALKILDRIAEIKHSDAILAQVKNSRIPTSLLKRYGWERHLGGENSTHVIRRFYGNYPSTKLNVREDVSRHEGFAGV